MTNINKTPRASQPRAQISSLCVIVAASFLLSACGVKGSLKTPPPLWGDKNKTQSTDKPSANLVPHKIKTSMAVKVEKRGSNI